MAETANVATQDSPELRLREIQVAADRGLINLPDRGRLRGFVRTWFVENWGLVCVRRGFDRSELRPQS